MRGGFDFRHGRAMEDELRRLVEELPDGEVHGDGLFIPKHVHTRKAELLVLLNAALAHIEAAEQLCTEVSLAL